MTGADGPGATVAAGAYGAAGAGAVEECDDGING